MPTPTSATRSTVAVLARQRYKARHRQALPAWKVVRGDRVQLLGGKDAGKQGVVQAVLRQQNRVIVAGLNVRKRKVSATPQATGFIHLLPSPVHVSSVALVDPVHNQATRVRVAVDASGRHVRVSRRSGAVIPKPVELAEQGKGKRTVNARTDTPQDAVAARSIQPIDFDAIAGFIQQRREAALQRQRQEEQQRMQRRERRKARTALTAHLNPAQAADALALAPSIEAAQLVQPQPQPQPQYSFAASSPHSPTMAPPLRRHFPARLPSLPPYPYSRASTLVGQWKEVRSRQTAPAGMEYTHKP